MNKTWLTSISGILLFALVIYLWPRNQPVPTKEDVIEQAYQFLLSSLERDKAVSSIDCMNDDPFHKTGEQGDIVLSSIFLQALSRAEKVTGKNPSMHRNKLVEYLENNRKQDLWGYRSGFICTSTDSAFAVEALLQNSKQIAFRALESISIFEMNEGFSPQICGGSHSCAMPENPAVDFWCQEDLHTTAHISYL